jgi:hypothetical protein
MTTYKEGTYTNYLQWQNKDENKAHFTSGGKCRKSDSQQKPAAKQEPEPIVEKAVTEDLNKEMYANIEAAKVWPVKIKAKEGFPTVDINEKSRNILAQVFYKKLMDAYTALKLKQTF